MRRPVELRVAKWTARMAGEGISPIMSRRLVAATQAYSISAEAAATLEDTVHQVLNGITTGVAVFAVPAYLALARQLSRLVSKFSGETLVNEAEIAMTTWVARGLDSDACEAIRNALGIGEPA